MLRPFRMAFLLGIVLGCHLPAWAMEPGSAVLEQPGILVLSAGPWRVEFTERPAWTMRRVWHGDVELMSPVGAFQTVVNVRRAPDDPEQDPWIGTGHGKEVIQRIVLRAGGAEHELAEGLNLRGEEWVLAKTSRLGPYRLTALVQVSARGIVEDFAFEVIEDDSAVNFIYVFMHCWSKATREWLAALPDGDEEHGVFLDDASFSLRKDMRWAALFAPDANLVALLVYPEAYEGAPRQSNKWWNRKRDNKLYFQPALPRGVGATFRYQAAIEAAPASADDWKEQARRQAEAVVQAFPQIESGR